MNTSDRPTGERSITIGGNASHTVLQTGDSNTATLTHRHDELPAPERVDIRATLDEIKTLLAGLETPDRKKIDNALAEAGDELAKPEPDHDEIGRALDRALGYAKKAEGFATSAQQLAPVVAGAAAWLGSRWHALVNLVG